MWTIRGFDPSTGGLWMPKVQKGETELRPTSASPEPASTSAAAQKVEAQSSLASAIPALPTDVVRYLIEKRSMHVLKCAQ